MKVGEDISTGHPDHAQQQQHLRPTKRSRAPTGQQVRHETASRSRGQQEGSSNQTTFRQLRSISAMIDSEVRGPPEVATSFWPNHQRHYSSSQAQLQSLTSEISPSAGIMEGDGRKTTPRHHSKAGQVSCRKQLLSRSQVSLVPAASTKPMTTTSAPDDAIPQRQPPNPLTMLFANTRQHRTLPLISGRHRSLLNHRAAAPNANHHQPNGSPSMSLLPPPYSADPTPATIPLLTSQQHVICGERPVAPIQVQPLGQQQQAAAIHLPASQQQQHHHHHNHSSLAAGNRADQSNSNNGSTISDTSLQVHQSSSTSANNQRVLNFLNANNQLQQQQQNASNFPSLFSHTHLYLLNNNHHDPPSSNNAATNLLNQCFQQQANNSSGISKSRSCLTCADISIKWYIAVIALLGLICALIGTIVGAVHSAGRDYISLALLLIGVGLVLVAISWIALRISVKTYKSSSPVASPMGGRSSSGRNHSRHSQQLNSVARLLSQAQAQAQGNLRTNQLNERLYMVAAAAAAAAALQSQTGAPRPGDSSGRSSSPVDPQQPPAQEAGSASNSLLRGIKRRLPRRFARLMPNDGGPSGSSSRSPDQSSQQPPHNNSRAALAAATALLHQFQQQQLVAPGAAYPAPLIGGCNPAPTRPSASSSANSGAAAAAAAAAAFALLYPPSGALPPAHLYPAFPGRVGEFPFRPPPPSYNAAMQDQRLRMLLQERIGLQAAQMSAMFPSANLPPPAPTAARQPNAEDTQAAETTATPSTSESSEPSGCSGGDSIPVTSHSDRRQTSPNTAGSSPLPSASHDEPTLITNDIYISSSPSPSVSDQQQRPVSGSSSSVVSIGGASSQPQSSQSLTSGGASSSSRDQSGATQSRAEAKILGYL